MDKKSNVILVICLISTLFVASFLLIKNEPMKFYTHGELKSLSEKELYEVFVENGLKVDEELQGYLTEDQIAKMLEEEFDLLVQGYSQRSHSMYLQFGEEVKRVYELILNSGGV